MKKLLPLICLLLLSGMAFAYQATVFGYVKEANGTAVPNIPVLVKIVSNNVLLQSKTVLTQSNGKYIAVFTLDDAIQEAKAIIEVQDCNNVELSKTVGFSKSNPLADAHFTWCASGCELEVKIEKLVTSNGGIKLKAVATGGSGPFSYAWNSGQTTQVIEVSPNLNTYCVIVTDANGCTGKACLDVVGQDDCSVEIEKVALDNAGTTFSLKAVTKGNGPFTYKWSNGADGPSITVKESGVYCVTITSADGCTAQDCITIEIKGNTDCGVEIIKVPATTPNGSFSLKALAKGKAPFTYKWSTGETTESIVVEKPGEYCVVVTDANGCEAKACVTVKFGNTSDCGVKILVFTTLDPGIVKLVALASGQGPFQYKWTNGATTPSILVEIPGEFCVAITNNAGCEAKACITLPVKDPKDCAIEIVKQPTPNSVDYFILKAVAKGVAPFTYKWNTGETTPEIKITKPGEYCVVVVDANGCEAKACILIKGKDEGPKDCAVHIKLKPLNSSGAFTLYAVTKGSPPFSFIWSTGEVTQGIEVKEPGLYCVTVTNDEGCEATTCLEIDKDGVTGPGATETGFKVLETYPQPALHEVNVRVSMPVGGALDMDVIHVNGGMVQSLGFDYLEAGEHLIQLPLQDLAPGVFIIRMRTGKEQVLTKVIKAL